MPEPYKKGVVDATNRILRSLLKKPFVKSSIKTTLNNIDPDAAPELARTLLWQDPEIVFSLLASLPALANVFIRFVDEVLEQLRKTLSPTILHDYLESLLQQIDQEAVGRIKENLKFFREALSPLRTSTFLSPNQDNAKIEENHG